MSNTITVTFEFPIGVLLFIRGSQHTSSHRPIASPVASRFAEECSGGIQCFYRLQGHKDPVSEVVLCREEPPYRPTLQAAIDDRISYEEDMAKARDERWREDKRKRGQ